MASKVKMIGLSWILNVDDALVNENNDFVFLCDDYRARSILSFCITGKFLDQ